MLTQTTLLTWKPPWLPPYPPPPCFPQGRCNICQEGLLCVYTSNWTEAYDGGESDNGHLIISWPKQLQKSANPSSEKRKIVPGSFRPDSWGPAGKPLISAYNAK